MCVCHSHGPHVVFGVQWDLQDLDTVDDSLLAGRGDGLAGDAVHLVESVLLQRALLRRANEHLQGQRLMPAIPTQLRQNTHTVRLVQSTTVCYVTHYLYRKHIQC